MLPDGSWRVELAALLAGDTDAAVSPDGRRVAFASSRDGIHELYVADGATGRAVRLTRSRAADRRPAWSPDGQSIAWQSAPADGAADLLVMRADGTRKRLLVGGPGDDVDPAWSPDGSRVAFSSNRSGRRQLWAVPARGGEPEQLAETPGRARAPAWSPEGRRIAFAHESGGRSGIWLLDVASGSTRPLTRGAGWDSRPNWSPSGVRIAFARAAAGRSSIWVVRPNGAGSARVAGSDGLEAPDWAETRRDLVPRPDERLPDLDQRAPAELVVMKSGHRFRLGFASNTENRGVGPLVIRGVRRGDAMRAHQVVELRGGGTRVVRDVGRMHYELHQPHFHWHLQSFVIYEIRRASDHRLAGRDRKTGFCLLDRWGRTLRHVPGTGPPRFTGDCGAGRPNARRVEQGTSVGYIDRYGPFFHGQHVDVTGLPAGRYVLVHHANPRRVMRELAYSNNAASLLIEMGWPNGRSATPRVTVLRRCDGSDRCA